MSRLRELRQEKHLSQKQLAAVFGLSESVFSLYEAGKHQPKPEIAFRIADYFGVTVDDLGWHSARAALEKASDPNRKPTRKQKLSGMDTPSAFSENLRALMQARDVNTVQLSEIIGVSRSTVSSWLHRGAFPRVDALEALSTFFGVPVPALQSGSIADFPRKIPFYNDPQSTLTVFFCDPADCAFRNTDTALAPFLPVGCTVLCSTTRPLADGALALCTNQAGQYLLAFVYRPAPGQPIPGLSSTSVQQAEACDAPLCPGNDPNSPLPGFSGAPLHPISKSENERLPSSQKGMSESAARPPVVVLPCNRAPEPLFLHAVAVEYRMPLNRP